MWRKIASHVGIMKALLLRLFQRRKCGFLIDVRQFGPTFILVDQMVRASNIYCSRPGLEIFS